MNDLKTSHRYCGLDETCACSSTWECARSGCGPCRAELHKRSAGGRRMLEAWDRDLSTRRMAAFAILLGLLAVLLIALASCGHGPAPCAPRPAAVSTGGASGGTQATCERVKQ